jgi:hypothetical protein
MLDVDGLQSCRKPIFNCSEFPYVDKTCPINSCQKYVLETLSIIAMFSYSTDTHNSQTAQFSF